MRDRSGTILLIVLLAVMTCLPLLQTGYTTSDDAYLALRIQEGRQSSGYVVAMDSGRLQHLITGNVAPLAYAGGRYWLMKTLAIGAIFATIGSMFYALRLISGSSAFATLTVVFFFSFVQHTHDHNLLTAYPVLSTTALTAFWLSIATWWLALQGRRRMAVVSVVLFVCSLLVYENFLVYACVFPVLTLLMRQGSWPERLRRAAMTPHVFATVGMLVAILGFRMFFQTDIGRQMMATEQYVFNFDLRRIWKVIERYGSSAFPLHYARVYRPMITDFYMGYGVFRVTLRDVFKVVEVAWLVKAVIVAYLTFLLTTRREQLMQQRGVLWFIALVLIVLTNLPLAITTKYQAWAIENYSHGYLTSYFVFFGVVILLALLIEGAVSWVLHRSRRGGYLLAGVFATLAFVVCYSTDLINAHVAHTEKQMYDKWKTVDQWIASPSFRAIPEGSLILAPSLFEHYPGTVHVFDDYWTDYVRLHGKKRKVEVLREREDWFSRAKEMDAADRLYFLELTQEQRGDASYLVFGRVIDARPGMAIASTDLDILAHARADRFRIMGRLFGSADECRARVFVNGAPTDGTFSDRFGAHVDVLRNAREWLWVRLSSAGASMAPDSILITDAAVPVDGPVDVLYGKGFHLDEVTYRWAEQSATLTLRNRTDRVVRADLQFEVQAPALTSGASARLEVVAGEARATWPIGPDLEKRVLPVEIPARASLDVLFSTNAPKAEAPLDPRTLVMKFLPDIRAREAGCQKTT
jgi:hypothetical protein